jgi:hypothetical protein
LGLHGLFLSSDQVKTDQDALDIREIANDFSDWHRQLSHQRGYGEDLVAGG